MEDEKVDTLWERAKQEILLPEKTEDQLDVLAEAASREVVPWAKFHKWNVYYHARDRSPIRSPHVPDANGDDVLEVVDIVNEFFYKGKPNWKYLSKHVDYYVFFFVTEGRIRSDHNKKTRIFKKSRNGLTWLTWSSILKKSKPNDWNEPISCYDDWMPLFKHISDTCNLVMTQILRRLSSYDLSRGARQKYQNLLNHPEFVATQKGREHAHKNFLWRYIGRAKGGNAGYTKPPAAERVPKQSVHQMMRDIHVWLPDMRTRKTKK